MEVVPFELRKRPSFLESVLSKHLDHIRFSCVLSDVTKTNWPENHVHSDVKKTTAVFFGLFQRVTRNFMIFIDESPVSRSVKFKSGNAG